MDWPKLEREEAERASSSLQPEDLVAMYRMMLLSRILDVRMFALNRQGRIPFVVPCQGHEGLQVAAVWALRPGQDFFCLYYRDLAAALAIGVTPLEILYGAFARAADPASGGRQMPQHYSDWRLRIFTGSSCVGTQIPHGAGIALATRIRRETDVTLVTFGEGATSKADFHEGINFAAIHELPVIFLCENNFYTISEPVQRQMRVQSVADRAPAYGIPGVSVDGNDVLATYDVVAAAAARARRGEGPTLIEARTYRLTPHTSDDDDRIYRSREEVEEWRKRDPIDRFRRYLEEHGVWDAAREAALQQQLHQQVDEAVEQAEHAPTPDRGSLRKHVYAEVTNASADIH